MAPANVSSSILTIITSFANGLEVLQKLKNSKRKGAVWSQASKRNQDDELRLSRSLRRGMHDIGREYQEASRHCDVERFAVGDATAQNSLAEILVKFNTGLISVFTSFLNCDKREKVVLDYQSLTELSEQSRTQSITTLRQLYHRILSKPLTSTAPAQPRRKQVNPRHRSSSKNFKPRNHPTLARVFIENSSVPSQIALVRPSEIKRQRSRTQSYQSLIHQSSNSALRPTSPPPPPYFPSDPLPLPPPNQDVRPIQPRHHVSSASLSKPKPRLGHKPSAPLPALNHKPSRTQAPRPTTLYSIASAQTGSTKLGEIPMHKWAVPWDIEAAEEANRKALEEGWPVVGAAAGAGGEERKKGVWERIFGRKGGKERAVI
ncbi:hypothetical protein WHR41_04448 [Cladosporium halotolerans]|uniref:Uncharacterized protein n=1 Tax=Cladosporium halotolerans TaxID=1052096 RepID=A0AB34KPW9_9PEZI